MLVLSRKKGETLVIGDNVKIKIVDIEGDKVKIGIEAPKELKVWRYEIFEEIQKENLSAIKSKSTIDNQKLKELFKKQNQ